MALEAATLVHIGDIPLWMLTTDYQLPRFVDGQARVPDIAPLNAVFDHYWKFGLDDFAFLDVGAKYGLSTILAARYIDSHGHQNRIVCFEPGAAAALIAQNLAMNGLAGRVTVEFQAVSDRSQETIIYGDPTHPEDDHIIRRNVNLPLTTRRVQTVALDSYLDSQGIQGPLVIKIDTQGAEWEVWRGMERTIAARPVTIMTEFTPWTFEGRAEPAAFLRKVSERHEIINLRPKNLTGSFQEAETPFQRVAPDTFEEFTQSVASSPGGWTDLLCIPRQLRRYEELAETALASDGIRHHSGAPPRHGGRC